MEDFNSGGARSRRGLYQNSQFPYYGNNERYMHNTGYPHMLERPGYQRNIVQPQGYNYSNIYEHDEREIIPGGFSGRFSADNAANRKNASQEAASSNYSRGGPNVINSNDKNVRDQQYYNANRPTGDSLSTFTRRAKEEGASETFPHSFHPNTPSKGTINHQQSVSINSNQVEHERVPSNFGGLSSTSGTGGRKYIPPPPPPPPVPSVFNNHEMSFIKNIIHKVNSISTTKQAEPMVNPSPVYKQSITAGREHEGTLNTPQLSSDSVDDPYAPIICSSKKTVSPLTMVKTLFKAVGSVNKPMYAPKVFTPENANINQTLPTDQSKPISMRGMTTGNLNVKNSTVTPPLELALSPYNSNYLGRPQNNRDSSRGGSHFQHFVEQKDHSNFYWKNQSTKSKIDDDENDRNGMTSVWHERQYGNIAHRGIRGNKRPHNKSFGGRYGDEIPKKRNRWNSKELKCPDDYDDGWNIIRHRKFKFKQLFPIQAMKINELMLRMNRVIKIPKTPRRILSTNVYDLTEEEIFNQAFQQKREKLRKIAEERTAKKRERRRRRKMNKNEFIKHFLGKV